MFYNPCLYCMSVVKSVFGSMINARQLKWSQIKCVIQSVLKHQYCIWLGPLMDVWLRWNHQPTVIILHCFLERLASMKSSACGQYYSVSLKRLASMKSSACGSLNVWLRWNHQPAVNIIVSLNVWLRWNHQPAVNIILFPWTFGFDEIISLRSIFFVSLNVWLRWNHQPAVNIMVSFLERLASMKSSACGQYYALVLVSLRWNNSIYFVYNNLFLLLSVSKHISKLMRVHGKIYWNYNCSWNHSAFLVYNILLLLIISVFNKIC